MKLLLIFLFITSFGWAQTTYKSLGSDYYYPNQESPKFEWIKRELKLNEETLTVISYGKMSTDIQKWDIQCREINYDTKGSSLVLYTTLASSENKLPGIFYILSNLDDVTDKIIFEVPEGFQDRITEGFPSKVLFFIE